MRWLILDEVLEIQAGKSASALSHIPTSQFSQESLLIEMMAQTGGLLVGAVTDFRDNLVFAKIEYADFFFSGVLQEKIHITANSETVRPEGSWVEANVSSAKGIMAQAKLMLVCVENLVPGIHESVTFHQAFMDHFNVKAKIK